MTNNKLTLVESIWFPKTIQNSDSNYQYEVMLFEFLPCDNHDKSTDRGEDQPIEVNVTYDVLFLTYDTLTSSMAENYNKTELEKSL